MAGFRAVGAVAEAVLHVLRSNYRPADFDQELEFKVFTARDFSRPLSAGVSLFLYRIMPNGVHRIPAGRRQADGRRAESLLPLDLHLLLTVWGQEASLQHALAGWMMRLLEDHPIFPATLLNAVTPGTFRAEESIEVSLAELSNEDLLRLWDTLVQNVYQLSIPYVARILHLESTRQLDTGLGQVQERGLDTATLVDPGNTP
ncbi:MAG: Pvc16 family protein [Acidobacteriota bacterium]